MDYKKKTFALKNFCKKHGVAKQKFGDPFSGKELLLCPICNKIKNAKRDIVDEKKRMKRELFFKRKELLDLKKSLEEDIERKKKSVAYLESQRGET